MHNVESTSSGKVLIHDTLLLLCNAVGRRKVSVLRHNTQFGGKKSMSVKLIAPKHPKSNLLGGGYLQKGQTDFLLSVKLFVFMKRVGGM